MEVGGELDELIERRVKETDALDCAVGVGHQDRRSSDRATAIHAHPFQARPQLQTMFRGELDPVVHGAGRIKETANSLNAPDWARQDRCLERRLCTESFGELFKCRS